MHYTFYFSYILFLKSDFLVLLYKFYEILLFYVIHLFPILFFIFFIILRSYCFIIEPICNDLYFLKFLITRNIAIGYRYFNACYQGIKKKHMLRKVQEKKVSSGVGKGEGGGDAGAGGFGQGG